MIYDLHLALIFSRILWVIVCC